MSKRDQVSAEQLAEDGAINTALHEAADSEGDPQIQEIADSHDRYLADRDREN